MRALSVEKFVIIWGRESTTREKEERGVFKLEGNASTKANEYGFAMDTFRLAI